jgi:hypothetical protein
METIKSLFDFKFNVILTSKVLRVLYAIIVFITVLATIGFVITGISENQIGYIIFGPVGSALYLMFIRIIFESLIIKFQMAQDIREIKSKYLSNVPPPPNR